MPYRQRIYNSYVKTAVEGETSVTTSTLEHLAYDFLKTIITPFFPKNKQIRILDLGCGYGAFLYACMRAGYKKVMGVDTSPEQVALAYKLWKGQVIQSDIRGFLERKKEDFEVITAIDVLEHFGPQEIMVILDLIHAALSPNGLFILRAPNGESPFAGRYRYGDFSHEICFTRNSLQQVMKTVGFSEVSCYELAPVVHGTASALRYIFWRLIRTALWFYQVVETGVYRDRYIFSQNLLAVGRK
jgi:2-polyprenyl-3-methyl-5-hydroxy-6-metoxy-1,4-benzoquinol methylase